MLVSQLRKKMIYTETNTDFFEKFVFKGDLKRSPLNVCLLVWSNLNLGSHFNDSAFRQFEILCRWQFISEDERK